MNTSDGGREDRWQPRFALTDGLTGVAKLHALGWRHKIGLEEGIARTYEWFQRNNEVRR